MLGEGFSQSVVQPTEVAPQRTPFDRLEEQFFGLFGGVDLTRRSGRTEVASGFVVTTSCFATNGDRRVSHRRYDSREGLVAVHETQTSGGGAKVLRHWNGRIGDGAVTLSHWQHPDGGERLHIIFPDQTVVDEPNFQRDNLPPFSSSQHAAMEVAFGVALR